MNYLDAYALLCSSGGLRVANWYFNKETVERLSNLHPTQLDQCKAEFLLALVNMKVDGSIRCSTELMVFRKYVL